MQGREVGVCFGKARGVFGLEFGGKAAGTVFAGAAAFTGFGGAFGGWRFVSLFVRGRGALGLGIMVCLRWAMSERRSSSVRRVSSSMYSSSSSSSGSRSRSSEKSMKPTPAGGGFGFGFADVGVEEEEEEEPFV